MRKFKYNLTTQSFSFSNATFGSPAIPEGKLVIGTIILDKPTGLQIKNASIKGDGIVGVKQSIYLRVPEEKVAINMEDNADQIKILFLFYFTGVKEFRNNVFENLITQDYYFLTRMNKVVVYNSETGEIYKEFKSALPTAKK